MPGAPESSPKAKPSTLATGAEAFFGLALETRLGADGPSPGVIGTREEATAGRRFVPYEPFRFSAEFWGVGELREKQRLYSETFFYAGVSPLFFPPSFGVDVALRSRPTTSTSRRFRRRAYNSVSTSIAKTPSSPFPLPRAHL